VVETSNSDSRISILAAGVDSLYLSAKGELRPAVLELLERLQTEARTTGDPAVFTTADESHTFLVNATGLRRHRFWLRSPGFELLVGSVEPHPEAYMQLHSAYIHHLGVESALGESEQFLGDHIFAKPPLLTVSRIDLHADEQGWEPTMNDLARLVTRARRRQSFEQVHMHGRQLNGFTFGRSDVVARIYDKTLQMRTKGESWTELIWKDRDPEKSVWRIEFQFRRSGLRSLRCNDPAHIDKHSPQHVLEHRQDLWEYGNRWLSLRHPIPGDTNVTRWPEATDWTAIREAEMGSPRSSLIRERIRGDDERRLIQGLIGYATSLTAIGSAHDLCNAITRNVPEAGWYLASHRKGWSARVEEKRHRRLTLRKAS